MRLVLEEQKQQKYAAQLGRQGKKIEQLKRTLKQQAELKKLSPQRKSPTPSTPAATSTSAQMPGDGAPLHSDVTETVVTNALAALDAWMRLRGYRPIDLFRMCDVNTSSSSTNEGDDMLDADEFRQLFDKKLDVKISHEDVEEIIRYLDIDGNGEIDVQELSHALKRARRAVVPRDPMHIIAHKLTKDPYSKIISMPTGAAIRLAGRQKKHTIHHLDTHHEYKKEQLHLEELME